MDQQKTKALLDAIRGGADIRTAAQFAGINFSTVYRWVELGQRENERIEAGHEASPDDQPYLELWQALRKARADAIVRNVAQIQKAANQGDWRAAAWWLERNAPESFDKN